MRCSYATNAVLKYRQLSLPRNSHLETASAKNNVHRLGGSPPALSVVVPVYNEAAALPICYERLRSILDELEMSYEMVFVDDGSDDGSTDQLVELARATSCVRLIQLSRNFGKEAALTAGVDHSAGDALIVLDADLQDPPELIPEMIREWRNGADVVLMRRRSRAGETPAKKIMAHVYYRLLNRLSDVPIPEDTGDFRLLSRRAVNALKRLPERGRYMKGLFAWIGMPTSTIVYDRAPRVAGNTKWGFIGLCRLAVEGITSFSVAPLRLATGFGATFVIAGGLASIALLFRTFAYGESWGTGSIISAMSLFAGVQLLAIGLLGSYVGKIYTETKQRPIYLVQQVVGAAPLSGSSQDSTATEYA